MGGHRRGCSRCSEETRTWTPGRFDALTRVLARPQIRRGLLQLLAALPLGLLASALPDDQPVSAVKKGALGGRLGGRHSRNRRGRDRSRRGRDNKKGRKNNGGRGSTDPDNCGPENWEPAADLSGCDLRGENLSGRNLANADLSRARLNSANLRRTNLLQANLTDANLDDVKLDAANLTGANLNGARNTTDGQLADAITCNTTMPDGSENDDNC